MFDQQKTQKNQTLPILWTEEQAREYFEAQRWPNGVSCVHCGEVDVYRVGGNGHRPGLFHCRGCKGQFTVTVGTVMEDSHIPLNKWAMAFHLMASAKKGISALQMQRNLGLGSYRSAWHLCHRIREAMRYEPLAGKLGGVVQVDETYVGGKPRKDGKYHPRGRGTAKAPVVALIERSGNVHTRHTQFVTTLTLKAIMDEVIQPTAAIHTDELPAYKKAAAGFAGGHHTVNHRAGEYFNRESGAHTNTAESYFSLLKRGVYGTFHSVSKKHLHRYCSEFDFRWNGRKISDVDRRDLAVRMSEGKRLPLKSPSGLATGE